MSGGADRAQVVEAEHLCQVRGIAVNGGGKRHMGCDGVDLQAHEGVREPRGDRGRSLGVYFIPLDPVALCPTKGDAEHTFIGSGVVDDADVAASGVEGQARRAGRYQGQSEESPCAWSSGIL